MPAQKKTKSTDKTKGTKATVTEERLYYIYNSCKNNGTIGKPKIIRKDQFLVLELDDKETEVIAQLENEPQRPNLISKS